MTKDSQPDNKKARMEKCNYQTPITEEGLNHNPNRKHKSVKRQGVSSDNFNPAGNKLISAANEFVQRLLSYFVNELF